MRRIDFVSNGTLIISSGDPHRVDGCWSQNAVVFVADYPSFGSRARYADQLCTVRSFKITVPPRLFTNGTLVTAYTLSFIMT
jgi:hypothetical protein